MINRVLASGLLAVGVSTAAQAQAPLEATQQDSGVAAKQLTPADIALGLLSGTLKQGLQGGSFSSSQQTDVQAAMSLLNGTSHATAGPGGTFTLTPATQGTGSVASADAEPMTRAQWRERREERRERRLARREAWKARHEDQGTSGTTTTSGATDPMAAAEPEDNDTSDGVAGNTAGGMTNEETEKLQAALNGKPVGSTAAAPSGELTSVQSAAVVEKNPLLKEANAQGIDVTPYVAQAAAADPTLLEGAPVAATPAATTQAAAAPLAAPQVSGFNAVWSEDFCNGFGLLSRYWGPGIDTSVPCQITLSSTPDNVDSGVMVPPTGATAGNGYGLYSFTLKMEGDAPGPYALLWPATDVWPGPELDIIERQKGGQGYSTIHKKADDGSNAYAPYKINGIDLNQTHTYSMAWLPGQLIGYVDGVQVWTTKDDVPADAAHGGENSAPGFGMQTWWSADQQSGPNRITVFRVSYSTPSFADD